MKKTIWILIAATVVIAVGFGIWLSHWKEAPRSGRQESGRRSLAQAAIDACADTYSRPLHDDILAKIEGDRVAFACQGIKVETEKARKLMVLLSEFEDAPEKDRAAVRQLVENANAQTRLYRKICEGEIKEASADEWQGIRELWFEFDCIIASDFSEQIER